MLYSLKYLVKFFMNFIAIIKKIYTVTYNVSPLYYRNRPFYALNPFNILWLSL